MPDRAVSDGGPLAAALLDVVETTRRGLADRIALVEGRIGEIRRLAVDREGEEASAADALSARLDRWVDDVEADLRAISALAVAIPEAIRKRNGAGAELLEARRDLSLILDCPAEPADAAEIEEAVRSYFSDPLFAYFNRRLADPAECGGIARRLDRAVAKAFGYDRAMAAYRRLQAYRAERERAAEKRRDREAARLRMAIAASTGARDEAAALLERRISAANGLCGSLASHLAPGRGSYENIAIDADCAVAREYGAASAIADEAVAVDGEYERRDEELVRKLTSGAAAFEDALGRAKKAGVSA